MDRRPLIGRGPVRGSPWGPRAWHWRVLPLRFCHGEEKGTSTLPHETKRSSDALKPPRIRRAVSTLVYATPLHPAQRHLPWTCTPLNPPFFGQVGWQVRAGGGHARADSTVRMITNKAALLGSQGHGHPLGCRHLHPLEDAPQRNRGHHLGGSSSVWRCSRRGLACSSSSGDESFCTCWEHTWNVMMLCSLMRIVEFVTLQPVLSRSAFFGACVCSRVSTRVVQTCAVTCP